MACAALVALLPACAGKKKADEAVSLAKLQGKRVAVAEVRAEPETRTQIEVALVNEILEHGRFEIVDRATAREALVTYPAEADWQRLGKHLGADLVLSVRVPEFRVVEAKGYDHQEVEDSVLAEEAGDSKPVKALRYKKVKSYAGTVRLNIVLFDVARNAVAYEGAGEARDAVSSRDAKLESRMRLLERLTRTAITDFFEKMPK